MIENRPGAAQGPLMRLGTGPSGEGQTDSDVAVKGLRVEALRCLSRRDYSRAQLRARLMSAEVSEAAVEAVLDDLQLRQLLSDARYASQRVAVRAARYGNARLAHELRTRGVSGADIAAALPEGGEESARCRALWRKKFGVLPANAAERARQMRFLYTRGFSTESIRAVLSGAGEDDEDGGAS